MKTPFAVVLFVLALLGAGGCLWLTGLHQHLNLAELKQAQAAFVRHYAANPVQTTLLYFGCFALLTACCLPGAAVLMLLAGASFGIVWGSVVAVLASTVGATLTMLASRHLLRRQAETRLTMRFARRLDEVNRGLASEGAFYLLSLRLLPVIPFIPVNLLSGLTRLPTATFFWASLVGMLPGTIAYVNAGMHLGSITSLDDIFSPGLWLALLLLGLVPLFAKVAVQMCRQRFVRQVGE